MVIFYVMISIVAGAGTFLLFQSTGFLPALALTPFGASIAAFVAAMVLYHRSSRQGPVKGSRLKGRLGHPPNIVPPTFEARIRDRN
jgi:hypothetical protein